jgi:hypothetical protein
MTELTDTQITHYNNFIYIGIQAIRSHLDTLTEIKTRQVDAVNSAARRITSDDGYRQCCEEIALLTQQQHGLNKAALEAIILLENNRK